MRITQVVLPLAVEEPVSSQRLRLSRSWALKVFAPQYLVDPGPILIPFHRKLKQLFFFILEGVNFLMQLHSFWRQSNYFFKQLNGYSF